MEQINLGNTANDGSGTNLREAGEIINNNFTTLDQTKATVEQATAAANGVVWKATLAEVNAIDPLVIDTAYGVYGDGANNGYYYWDGTSATVDFNRKLAPKINSEVVSDNILNPIYIQEGRDVLIDNGNLRDEPNSISIEAFPISGLASFTVSGYTYNSIKYWSIKDDDGVTLTKGTIANAPFQTFNEISGAATFNFVFKTRVEDDAPIPVINEGVNALAPDEFKEVVTDIDGKIFNTDAVLNSDLEIEITSNIANPEDFVDGSYVNSAGDILTGNYWELVDIPIEDYDAGTSFTFGNFVISAGHCAFWNEAEKVEYAGSYGTSDLPKTVVKPFGATRLIITTMRSNVENTEVMVNVGASLLPYTPYFDSYVKAIKGYEVKSNGLSELPAEASFERLTVAALSVNLPEGAGTPPAEVLVNDAWIDTTDSTIKVKLS